MNRFSGMNNMFFFTLGTLLALIRVLEPYVKKNLLHLIKRKGVGCKWCFYWGKSRRMHNPNLDISY